MNTSFPATRRQLVESGTTLGSVIAVVTSYSVNNSILWGIVHGILSWLYVIYFAIAY
jgi:hypothetical protein